MADREVAVASAIFFASCHLKRMMMEIAATSGFEVLLAAAVHLGKVGVAGVASSAIAVPEALAAKFLRAKEPGAVFAAAIAVALAAAVDCGS